MLEAGVSAKKVSSHMDYVFPWQVQFDRNILPQRIFKAKCALYLYMENDQVWIAFPVMPHRAVFMKHDSISPFFGILKSTIGMEFSATPQLSIIHEQPTGDEQEV